MSMQKDVGISADEAVTILLGDASQAVDEINAFTLKTFKTRGGRLGSGMGSLLEALWVYHMNTILFNQGGSARLCELGWLQDHEPADFACLVRGAHWEPASRTGELFRIEAKSMNVGVDEAKGHFANLASETRPHDLLLVLIWKWTSLEDYYFWPKIQDYFLGSAIEIIALRDRLHLSRGGSFVKAGACPDGCKLADCTHGGEPLNAAGKRERRTGPKSRKPANVEYAANFGGLVRMLKTDGDAARSVFRDCRRRSALAHKYISFIHRHFPGEELNQYRRAEWKKLSETLGVDGSYTGPPPINAILREHVPDYQDKLRALFT